MKRFIVLSALLLTIIVSRSQIKETFSPPPQGWLLSAGTSFSTVNNNPGLVIPGADNYIGTPALMRVSSPIRICFTLWAYNSTLSSQTAFPCASAVDMIFVKSAVTTIEEGLKQENILVRINNFGLPLDGGTACFGVVLPPAFSATEFRIIFYFHASCDQGSIQYVIDNFKTVGLDEVCTKTNCAPTAMDDYFLRSNNGDLDFNAILYGRNSGYTLPAGYAFDVVGTDNDPNNGHSSLIWEIVSQPANGNVIINPDGSCTIHRNNGTVTQLVFRYRVSDPGADGFAATTRDNLSDTATVTVKWPSSSPTPESIINFNAIRNESLVTIRWTTNFESNVKGFELQRSNGNAVFQKVGFVNSKSVDGYSTVPLNYEFQETNSSRTVNLYRLIQENRDGTLLIYSIIAVRGDNGVVETIVFPNPTNTGKVTVIFQDQGEKEVSLTDLSGRTIKKWPELENGSLIIDKLYPGVYMLGIRYKNSGEYIIKKVVVSW